MVFQVDIVMNMMMIVEIVVLGMEVEDLGALEDRLFLNLEDHLGFIYYYVPKCV